MINKKILLMSFVMLIALSYALVFSDISQSNFNNGTYANTTHNGSAVILVGSNSTGTFTSRIFDAGIFARWNNFTWDGNTSLLDYIYAIDAGSDVWQSNDLGASWLKINQSYNGGGGATDMAINSSSSLFILDIQDLWKSDDNGITWSLVNDDINGAGDSNAGKVIAIDKNEYIYIIDGSEDVLKSTDAGASFTKVNNADFNGGNGAIFGIAINSTNSIFVVDTQADVWQSIDSGTTWTLIKDDYNGVIGNHATDMAINSSSSLFILDEQDVWQSVDNGVTWTKINDDFNGVSDGNNGFVINIDKNNYIYIIDGSQDVYNSTNSGSIFNIEKENFNGANGNVFGISSARRYSNLTFQVRNCTASCTNEMFVGPDGSASTYFTNLTNSLNLTGRYFQYKAYLSTENNITPLLFNLSVDYSLVDTISPSIIIASPQNSSYNIRNISLNYTIIEENINSCWYSIDSGENVSLIGCSNATFNVSDGSHTIRVYANDSVGNMNSSNVVFSVDSVPPVVTLNSPTGNIGVSQVIFNITIDEDADSTYFSLDNGITNLTMQKNGARDFNYTNSSIADGIYTARFYANDTLGNINSGVAITFVVDTTKPSLTIVYPGNISYNSIQSSLNYSVFDSNLQACWYTLNNGIANTTISCGANATGLNSGEGSKTWKVYANDTLGNINSSSITFFVDSISPVVIIDIPNEGDTYGNNESLTLNFSVMETNLQSCWYNIDNGNNISLTECANSTFNVSDGSHTLRVYANDTLGNLGFNSKNFSINLGAPAITLNSPIGNYLNMNNVTFAYSATDIDLQACELWGNFTGIFALNQTNNSVVSGANSAFSLNLSDGAYVWNVKCNDTQAHSAFNGNKTFFVDTILPQISLSEPTGVKSSRNNIQLAYSISDTNLQACWYNVIRGGSLEIANTSISCSGESIFNVTIDADFTAYIFANDSAGNMNVKSSSFSVATSSGGGSSGGSNGGSGGGSSGGGSAGIPNKKENKTQLEIKDISPIALHAGESKKIVLSIKNNGVKFLNNCRIIGIGKYSSLIKSEGTNKIGGGEALELLFNVETEFEMLPQTYELAVSVKCDELENSRNFSLEILEKKLEFKIIKVQREKNALKINYSLRELSGVQQNAKMQFILFDSENNKALEFSDSRTIAPNENKGFELRIPANDSFRGEYSLLVNINSDKYSTFVQEKVFIGRAISGFAVFGSEEGVSKAVLYGTIALFIGFVIFMSFRIFRLKKDIKKSRSVRIRTEKLK